MINCGYIAIIGRPSVGKSTLMNSILGQKVSITCKKPQTTRHQIIGIFTEEKRQLIFIDTPGLNNNISNNLDKYMNKAAYSIIDDVDMVLLVLENGRLDDFEKEIIKTCHDKKVNIIIAINKVDLTKNRNSILPFIHTIHSLPQGAEIVPISAKNKDNIPSLLDCISKYLPQMDEYIYPEEDITDRSIRFLASEIIREKVFRLVGEELPYQTFVLIDKFEELDNIINIYASIIVDKKSQKHIILGKSGSKIKSIGSSARVDIEELVENKVNLQLWVKVKSGWRMSEDTLQSAGYSEY